MSGYTGYIEKNNGKLVLHGYETEADLRRAERDIKRVLVSLAYMSVYEVIKELEPYRRAGARDERWEDEQVKC